MKRTNVYITLCLLTLCPLCANAQRWGKVQEFQEIPGDSISYTNKNKKCITDFVTYTCSGHKDAVFGLYPPLPSIGGKVSIILPKNGTVTTTKISDLVGLQIFHNPYDAECEDVKVYISLDSIAWELVSVESTYQKGSIDIPSIMHDSYYVKIINTYTPTVAIRSITYFMEKCNCFRYVP